MFQGKLRETRMVAFEILRACFRCKGYHWIFGKDGQQLGLEKQFPSRCNTRNFLDVLLAFLGN
jgi:hypothetical protein